MYLKRTKVAMHALLGLWSAVMPTYIKSGIQNDLQRPKPHRYRGVAPCSQINLQLAQNEHRHDSHDDICHR